tara:strand:- start:127 stop:519 length:393 start_codon:yes stop_codon:yes gene_type:complete
MQVRSVIRKSAIRVFVFSLGLSLLAINTPVKADDVTPFSEIMKLMQNKAIELDYIHGYRPFKVFKDGDEWILEQQENYEKSVIVDAGDNKITADDFPMNWPINGTWKFSKDGNKCRIDHTSDSAIMKWNC